MRCDERLAEGDPGWSPAEAGARRLLAAMVAAGNSGPVLVVACDDAVSLLAPAWAGSFAAAGWTHRVLVVGEGRRETAAIVAEAESLGAAAIIGAGDDVVIAASRTAATTRGLPFFAHPIAARPARSSWSSRSTDG